MDNRIAIIKQPHRVLDDWLLGRFSCGGRKPALKVIFDVSGLIISLLDNKVFDAFVAPDFLAMLVLSVIHSVRRVPWLNVEDRPQVFR